MIEQSYRYVTTVTATVEGVYGTNLDRIIAATTSHNITAFRLVAVGDWFIDCITFFDGNIQVLIKCADCQPGGPRLIVVEKPPTILVGDCFVSPDEDAPSFYEVLRVEGGSFAVRVVSPHIDHGRINTIWYSEKHLADKIKTKKLQRCTRTLVLSQISATFFKAKGE